MKTSILFRAALLVTIVSAPAGPGLFAQSPAPARLDGTIEEYTAQLDPAGPWHIAGRWSASLQGQSGTADFSAALSMVRSANPVPAAHTHHVSLEGGAVTFLANGLRINGTALITSNGNVAGFSGSPVEVLVTGGNGLPYSNVAVTFGGGAAAHFGEAPVHGVVVSGK
jgi:hypothetical protein